MEKETKNFKESFVSFWEKVKAVFEYLPNKLNNIHEQKVAAINVDSIAIPYRKLDCAKKMKDFGNGNKWIKLIISLASILVIIFLWWVLGTYTNVEIFLSNPQTVVKTFVSRVEQGLYWEDLSYSLTRVLVGFSLATVVSIPVAFLMAWYRPVRAAIDPFIQFLRTIPPLA